MSTMFHCMLFLWRPSGLSPSSINTNSMVVVILVHVLLRCCVRVSLEYVLPSGIDSYGTCKSSVLPGYMKVDLALCPCQQLASFSLLVFVFTSLRDGGSSCFICIFWFLMNWVSLHIIGSEPFRLLICTLWPVHFSCFVGVLMCFRF